jgi:nucleotide-binding universal stress UspA family protein
VLARRDGGERVGDAGRRRGVDVGMRAAFLCDECKATLTGLDDKAKPIFDDIERILDKISRASRRGLDVLASGDITDEEQKFDLFLCHNSEDKGDIRRVNQKLKNLGLRTWFDEEQIELGQVWQDELEKVIASVRCAAVFVGEHGISPWAKAELRAFLSEFADRGCLVIPVLISESGHAPELPRFLKSMQWVDLSQGEDRGLERIVRAIRSR